MEPSSTSASIWPFSVELRGKAVGPAFELIIRALDPAGGERRVVYELEKVDQASCSNLRQKLSLDFGLRPPLDMTWRKFPVTDTHVEPLLTTNIGWGVSYGYGDPAVLRENEGGHPTYYLTVTSNDAPNAFPVFHSIDLRAWSHEGFCFPEGSAPRWTLPGRDGGDFWAPEIHRVGREWWLCFTARDMSGQLGVGLAKSQTPRGPWSGSERPLVTRAIDGHIFQDADDQVYLVWKDDSNSAWPEELLALLHADPSIAPAIFTSQEDIRTACFTAALHDWIVTLRPMQRFLLLQGLIDSVTAEFSLVCRRLLARAEMAVGQERKSLRAVLELMRTCIFVQRLSATGELIGEAVPVLQNDQAWEAHLIEGPWMRKEAGKYYLLYAANDFSNSSYGLGCASADCVFGPYRKQNGPFVQSTETWWAPGHPSLAVGPDGNTHIFMHAYPAGEAGYKAFRALLTAPVTFTPNGVRLGLCL